MELSINAAKSMETVESDTEAQRRRAAVMVDGHQAKRSKRTEDGEKVVQNGEYYRAGKVKKIRLLNFMCHDALELTLNENVNFIVGLNGSGKSAILTALTVGLGTRANVTSGETSVEKFIKKGRNSATVEITLVNKGDTAYKPDIYGDTITVIRTIGNTSSYKIKNWRGEIVSTKRDELDSIITTMNIQIDNPISVLNQDVSRTFLVTSKPDEKYNLFMKATLLDAIENNYKEALYICEEEYNKLRTYSAASSQVKGEIQKLKESIHRLEVMDESRAELSNLEMELQWATAITDKNKLRKIQENLKTYENNLEELQNVELSIGTEDEEIVEIDTKIQDIKQKIQQTELEVTDSSEAYNSAKQEHLAANEALSNEQREWHSLSSKTKRFEDVKLLEKKILKLKCCNDEEHNERKVMTEQLSKLEERLNKLDALSRTKQTELMHLEADKMRLMQEVQSAKNEAENFNRQINKIKRDLGAVEQHALSVFGPNLPRLLKRIEEECKKKRFKEKPRGPIGAFIKLKDAAWAPAVESFFGYRFLSSFCVDNDQDAKLLNSIMKEIFDNENTPQMISSKFLYQVRDVRHHCTQSPQYSNLLDAMVIEDPVIANCLIDQREIECILLIPTSEEACVIMSDMTKVPRNCKKAFTLRGDTFFPDPNYRSYMGRCYTCAKYLHVSTMEIIQTLKEYLQITENKKQEVDAAYNAIFEKIIRTTSELNNVTKTVHKLRSTQSECTNLINDLKDEIDLHDASCIDVFRNEAAELEKKIAQESGLEKALDENVQQLQKTVESLDAEVKRCRDLRHNLHTVIDSLKDQIRELTREKERHRHECQHATRKLREIRQAIQCAKGEFEIQETAVNKAVSNATEKCPRINTTRLANQIKTLLIELGDKIREIENQFGCLDKLRRQLKKKEEKYGVNIEFAAQLKQSCEKHIERVEHRQNMFLQLRDLYSVCVQKAFTDVLSLRQYKGTVAIDHTNKLLELHVSVRDDKESGNDTKSLSGGERSYSIVAFILALWDCTRLPFYFLDEFEVFMDKINRRVIMDILLDYAKLHPQSQFAFFTSLDTSHILAEDCVTIHQLQPPERRTLN